MSGGPVRVEAPLKPLKQMALLALPAGTLKDQDQVCSTIRPHQYERWYMWLALKETLWELQHSTSHKQTRYVFNILFFHIEMHLQNQNWSLHIKCSTKQERWMETFIWHSIQIYGTDLFSNMQ